jgi:hypothetical protein
LPKEAKVVKKTKLPLVGGALMIIGVVAFAVTSWTSGSYFFAIAVLFADVFAIILVRELLSGEQKGYIIVVTIAVVTLFLEFWVSVNSAYYINFQGASISFLLTLLGAMMLVAAKQKA